jgi:uncharacterized protein
MNESSVTSVDGKTADWKRRTIFGTSMGGDCTPAWVSDVYASFRDNILDPKYPCYFASQAERSGSLYYSYVNGSQICHLPATLQTFLSVCENIGRDKNNLVVFFEPDKHPPTFAQHRAVFWNTLQYLQDHDPIRWSPVYPASPEDPFWDFPFAGQLFFVVGVSPTYRLHRSRNLSRSMTMVFQPREVFQEGANVIGIGSRESIRRRVQVWDGIQAHPDLNTYGEPGNIEWAQYFISDDNSHERGRCPLSERSQNRDNRDARETTTRSIDSKTR